MLFVVLLVATAAVCLACVCKAVRRCRAAASAVAPASELLTLRDEFAAARKSDGSKRGGPSGSSRGKPKLPGRLRGGTPMRGYYQSACAACTGEEEDCYR